MCTVTWWRESDRYVLFFNRDERRSRLPAIPPEIQCSPGGRKYIAPLDGDHGGTWLLVNDFGLTIGILNHYAAEVRYEPANPTSRGRIPQTLVDCRDIVEMSDAVRAIEFSAFRPLHLIGIDATGSCVNEWTWSGPNAAIESRRVSSPPITTSSFKSAAVRADRIARFSALPPESLPEALEDYHRLRNPGNEAYGVNMSRPDALTVSISRIEVAPSKVSFRYTPESDDPQSERSQPTVVTLDRVHPSDP